MRTPKREKESPKMKIEIMRLNGEVSASGYRVNNCYMSIIQNLRAMGQMARVVVIWKACTC